MTFRIVALLLLGLVAWAQPSRTERLKISAGDFYSAESILEVHRLEKGEDAEYKDGLAWVARGAALLGDWTAAAGHAAKLRKISEPYSAGHGTAIEVEAQVLVGRGKRKNALRFLEGELAKNAAAPVAFRSRIQKRWNQIGLVGRRLRILTGRWRSCGGSRWCCFCGRSGAGIVRRRGRRL